MLDTHQKEKYISVTFCGLQVVIPQTPDIRYHTVALENTVIDIARPPMPTQVDARVSADTRLDLASGRLVFREQLLNG